MYHGLHASLSTQSQWDLRVAITRPGIDHNRCRKNIFAQDGHEKAQIAACHETVAAPTDVVPKIAFITKTIDATANRKPFVPRDVIKNGAKRRAFT